MGIRGEPAPNTYRLPSTVGYQHHDPTLARSPAYTMRVQHHKGPSGLGPGMYEIGGKTRFGLSGAPNLTMGYKIPELNEFKSPGPSYYHPEKCYIAKENLPKFTMAKRTPLVNPSRAPGPNTYYVPSTLGPRVPDKHCNGAYTIGSKLKEPCGEGIPAPNKYGPVCPNNYKPAGARYTMRTKPTLAVDKTQKPAPNSYLPRPISVTKCRAPKFTMSRRYKDAHVTYLTWDDIRQ